MRALFGATSFSIYSEVVCAIILCSSVKSSGEKTRLGVVSVIKKLPPLKIVFCDATISSSFLEMVVGGWWLVVGWDSLKVLWKLKEYWPDTNHHQPTTNHH